MTDVLDLLVEAGAQIERLEMAACDVSAWPLERASLQSRIRALVFAADHQRLDVIDQLIEAGTSVTRRTQSGGGTRCRLPPIAGAPRVCADSWLTAQTPICGTKTA